MCKWIVTGLSLSLVVFVARLALNDIPGCDDELLLEFLDLPNTTAIKGDINCFLFGRVADNWFSGCSIHVLLS